MTAPKCEKTLNRVRIVDSLPPWTFCALVKAVAPLSASLPVNHRPPRVSMNCLICAVGVPKRVGVPKA